MCEDNTPINIKVKGNICSYHILIVRILVQVEQKILFKGKEYFNYTIVSKKIYTRGYHIYFPLIL